MKRISCIAPIDRPREKMIRKGPEALSEIELLAALLGSGTAHRDVMKLAADVSRFLGVGVAPVTIEKLTKSAGLGLAKACQIVAALELARRRHAPQPIRIKKAEDILPSLAFIAHKRQEYLVSVSLSGAGEILATRVVTIGLLDAVAIHPREVFADPLAERAAAIIIAHNHPSGLARPSRHDIRITRKLAEAGKLLGIPVLDHIIMTSSSYFSFRKHKLLR